jgi:hypothetical protein
VITFDDLEQNRVGIALEIFITSTQAAKESSMAVHDAGGAGLWR